MVNGANPVVTGISFTHSDAHSEYSVAFNVVPHILEIVDVMGTGTIVWLIVGPIPEQESEADTFA